MGNIPVLKAGEVIVILYKLGSFEVRQRGSHKQFRDSGGRCTTVPVHQGRDISPVLLRQVAKDIGLTLDELLRHRKCRSPAVKNVHPVVEDENLRGDRILWARHID